MAQRFVSYSNSMYIHLIVLFTPDSSELDPTDLPAMEQERLLQIAQRHGYTLHEVVGRGSFGCVHRVESHRYKDVDFVLKYMKLASDARLSCNEVDNLMQLSHPNIIRMYEYFIDEDYLFIILEYCPRGSLQDYIDKNGPIQGRVLWISAGQLIDALMYCHQRGVAHRDIKPANVLMDAYGRIKLADFGISWKFNADNHDDKSFTGSRAYMAPEVLRKEKRDAFLADIWSLGVTFFTMSNGALPFPIKQVSSFMTAVERAYMTFKDDVDPEFERIVRSLVKVVPIERATLMRVKQELLEREQRQRDGRQGSSRRLSSGGAKPALPPLIRPIVMKRANPLALLGAKSGSCRY